MIAGLILEDFSHQANLCHSLREVENIGFLILQSTKELNPSSHILLLRYLHLPHQEKSICLSANSAIQSIWRHPPNGAQY